MPRGCRPRCTRTRTPQSVRCPQELVRGLVQHEHRTGAKRCRNVVPPGARSRRSNDCSRRLRFRLRAVGARVAREIRQAKSAPPRVAVEPAPGKIIDPSCSNSFARSGSTGTHSGRGCERRSALSRLMVSHQREEQARSSAALFVSNRDAVALDSDLASTMLIRGRRHCGIHKLPAAAAGKYSRRMSNQLAPVRAFAAAPC